MSVASELEWEACVVEPRPDRELEKDVERRLGTVPPSVAYYSACPWIARFMLPLNPSRSFLVHMDPGLSERIWLAVSQDNACRYCYSAHRALLRILGLPEKRLRRLEEDLFSAELDPREALAIDFARRVARANPLPGGADKQPLRDAGYSEEAIKELAFLAAYICAANRAATLPALPPEPFEALPDRWLVRLTRPLIARRLSLRRGRRAALAPEWKSGPFSYLVIALDGLPVAAPLRQLIDAALDSPLLPRRAKLLVFAVVARGLGCQLSEREAANLLAAEGLEAEQLDDILSHLGSPELDPVEALIVPFARETIWYRTAAIQRRARALAEQLGDAQFLEVVGIASVGNMLSRLAIVLDLP